MSATDPPMCKLCRKAHWQSDGCDGKLRDRNFTKAVAHTMTMAAPMAKPANPGKLPTGRALKRVMKKKGRKKK